MFLKNDTIYYLFDKSIKNKIAAFDLDFTLIKTKSGKKFPIDFNDWELLNNKILNILKNLYNDNYSIVIFTNQRGISKGKMSVENFYTKFTNIKTKLNIPVSIILATGEDRYRKPMTGMWEFFQENIDINIDKENSFYVGDAAGRIYNNSKDHSTDDMYFANNIGLKFFTPEQYFKLNDKPHKINKFNLKSNCNKISFKLPEKNNLIILVGPPASGKSYIVKNYFKNYKYISLDKLKTKNKLLSKFKKYLIENNNIIIDNTNNKKADRNNYIKLATNYYKTIIYMDIPKEVVKYLNKYRVQIENKKYIKFN